MTGSNTRNALLFSELRNKRVMRVTKRLILFQNVHTAAKQYQSNAAFTYGSAYVNACTVVCQSKKCQKGVNSLQDVPPDDTQVNGAMLCCQYCHNIEAEYTEGRAAWHQSLDLLHCPVGLNATGSKHFNSNENTMRKIKIKGQIITLLHHILSLLGVLNTPFWD